MAAAREGYTEQPATNAASRQLGKNARHPNLKAQANNAGETIPITPVDRFNINYLPFDEPPSLTPVVASLNR